MQKKNNIKYLILLGLTVLFSFKGFASHPEEDGHHEEKEPFNAVEFARGHVLDAHEIHFFGEGESAFTAPLPIILYTNNGLEVFMSSAFHHGEHAEVMVNDKMIHGFVHNGFFTDHHMLKIYPVIGSHGNYVVDGNNAIVDLSITKNVAAMFLVCALLILIFFKVGKFYKKNGAVAPKGITSWMEPLIVFVRDDIAKSNIGHKYTKFMPFLLTVFFFILIGNLLGLVPFLSSPNLTGNISVTLTLAFFTLIIQLIFSKKAFWAHIFTPPGVPVALYPILVPIEIAGVFIKPIALLIRLFANITAGHIIVISLISIIFVNGNMAWSGLSIPMALFISVLEILVAFLQAYIFTMLSALFIGGAVAEDHH